MNQRDEINWRQTVNVLLILLFCVVFFLGCSLQSSDNFPDISYSTDSTAPTITPENTDSNPVSEGGTLKVAIPVNEECLKYITLMYAGEKLTLFNDNNPDNNGLTVSLNVLDSFRSDINVVWQTIPSTGYTKETLEMLALSNALPDIMLINNSDKPHIALFSLASFDESVLQTYLSYSMIYPTMIQNEWNDKAIQSLPYYASIKMLYANSSIMFDENNISLLPDTDQIDFDTIKTISKTITKTEKDIYGFKGLSDLLAFFPMTQSSSISSYMWNGSSFRYNVETFEQSVSRIRELVVTGGVEEFLTANQEAEKYSTNDPRILNKIGFWIDDSNQLESWISLTGSQIKRYFISDKEQSAIPLTVYSIVVNKNCKILDQAKDFAAYLAFDIDAMLFRSRYTIQNGFIPPVNDPLVWERLVKPQLQGAELYSIQNRMNYAKTVAANQEIFVKDIYNILYEKYFNDILFGRKSFGTFAEEIDAEANQVLLTK